MNIDELKRSFSIITAEGGVPYVTARPGVGKSESVMQWARSRADELNLPYYEGPENYDPNGFGFFDLRLATVDSIDLNGLPLIDSAKERTAFTRSPYIAEDGYGVLFLDELPQAKAGNQAAVSQLILDKRVGTHSLGKNWVIIAAGNRTEDRAATHKMPTHIANRLAHLELDFSLDVFVDHMHSINTHEAAVAFAKYRPDVLESFKPDQDINCTPRSFLHAMNYIDTSTDLQFSLMSGTMGEGATSEFIGFLNIYQNVAPFEDFVKNPKTIAIPTESSELFATTQMLSHRVDATTVDKVAVFINRMEDEPERIVAFWKEAIRKTPTLLTCKPFKDFTKDNSELLF